MSYNRGYNQNPSQGYGQANANEYGQYGPYGQSQPVGQAANNYAADSYNSPPQNYSQQTGYGQQAGYGQQSGYGQQRPGMQHQSSSQYDEERVQGGYEMGAVSNQSDNGPNRILNEVRNIDRTLDELENLEAQLARVRTQSLDTYERGTENSLAEEEERLSSLVFNSFTSLNARVVALIKMPDSGNPRNSAQIGKTRRRLQAAYELHLQMTRKHKASIGEQVKRNYLIANPDASPEEIERAMEDPSMNVYMDRIRRGHRSAEAARALENNEIRLRQMQKIEQTLIQLAESQQTLAVMIAEQDAQINQIGQKAEDVVDNVQHANTELEVAVDKSRAARKKRFICLGIIILIIIIIIVVVVVAVLVTRGTGNAAQSATRATARSIMM